MIKILINCNGYKGKYTNSLNNISSPPIWGNKIIIWERYSKYSEILFPHLKKNIPTYLIFTEINGIGQHYMIYIYRHRKQQKQKDFNPFLEYSSATFEMKLMHTQPQNSDR